MHSLTEKSKWLSYVLRHAPEKAGLTLDQEGWIGVDILLAASAGSLSHQDLLKIVAEDSKGRYTIQDDRIRANQGHSTEQVKLTFKKAVPPVVLFHGADTKALVAIRKEGLLPMSRHYVHLSHDLATAKQVGGRRKSFTILEIDAKQMLADGHEFFLSENGVWLVPTVAPKYLKESA